MDWLSPWDWTATDWAGVQCIVLVIAALVAWRQVREARKLREAQAEPFVVVDLEVDTGTQVISVVVSNLGATMARDVRLTFEPELTSTFDSTPYPPGELKIFREGIPSLPPGKRVSVLLDTFVQRDATQYPDVYRVTTRCYAPALKRHLPNDSVLDLGIYRNALNLHRNDIHDVHKRLEELVKQAKAIVTALGKLKPAGN